MLNMYRKFTEEQYDLMLKELFKRFPSFQLVGTEAYNPGLENMNAFDRLVGGPHRAYKVIHVAGTNGKGSVSSMLTSVLSANGMRVGLFTSPHILDFRERARIVEGDSLVYISKEFIWEFCQTWRDTFDSMDLSLFEISTMMAFKWFEIEKVDVAVVETGLGGRLDSTNIVEPMLSIITNIGFDHCNILGETLPEIAFEKAGIIKPGVPVVVGESCPEIDDVFKCKVSEPSLLTFADREVPSTWKWSEQLLENMDLQGDYQRCNLRTVLAALDKLTSLSGGKPFDIIPVTQTAARTDFHGRWEQISQSPRIICDIAHNEHGLRPNMQKLSRMLDSGEADALVIVFGIMSDKDFDRLAPLLPLSAEYIFTSAQSPRALKAEALAQKYLDYCMKCNDVPALFHVEPNPVDALRKARMLAGEKQQPLIYVGGSTYVVAEVMKANSSKL